MSRTTHEHARNIHEVRYEVGRADERPLLLTSDWHIDNPKCKRELLFRHLNEAKDKGALVFCFGDLFCMMQGKYDKRSDKSDVRPEHAAGNYIDQVINDTAEVLKPWHDILFVIGEGNHESSIRRHLETDVLDRFVERVKFMTPSSPICRGGYGGWVKVTFERGNDYGRSSTIKYFHGSGGGGPVTKGAIQQQRHAVIYDGADIVYSGHIHESQSTVFVKERFVSQKNSIIMSEQEHLRGATYKEEYEDGYGGFHIEGGRAPKPLGGWWVNYRLVDDAHRLVHDSWRAK